MKKKHISLQTTLLVLSLILTSCHTQKIDKENVLSYIDQRAEKLKKEILSSKSSVPKTGTVYYVSASEGNDSFDGLSPEHPVQSLQKVTFRLLWILNKMDNMIKLIHALSLLHASLYKRQSKL